MKKLFFVFLMTLVVSGCNQSKTQSERTSVTINKSVEEMLSRMRSLVDSGIMIGHQDDLIYGHSWKSDGVSDIKQVTGDYPAVFGWELGNLELGDKKSLDSVSFTEIIEGIKWVHQHNGFNTISWHCNNPLTGGNAWDVSSDQVVKSILPGGEKNDTFNAMLEELVTFFASLKDDKGQPIPVIFRPYHEHTGSWFWWGQNLCTTNEYISLWQYTLAFFKDRGIDNLAYAYSSASGFRNAEKYLERYPGDSLIQIIGFDTYQGSLEDRYNYLSGLKDGMDILIPIAREHNKIPILAETGFEGVKDSTWWTETLWPAIKEYPLSYVLFWRNAHDRPDHFYGPFPEHPSAENFRKLEAMEQTLFLEDVQK